MFADEKSDATVFTLFGSTITVILLVTPCDFTEILQLPGATATIFPFDETFATDVFVDLYVNISQFDTPLSESLKMKSRDLLIHNNRLPAERTFYYFTKR